MPAKKLVDDSTLQASFFQRNQGARRVRSVLKKVDLFKFAPIPRHLIDQQVSVRGLIGTVIVLVILIAYIGVSFQRFLNGTPSVSSYLGETDNTMIPLPPLAFTFRPSSLNVIFYNESYFRFAMSIETVSEQDFLPRTFDRQNYTSTPCNFTVAGKLGMNAHCPRNPPALLGRYSLPVYSFFRVDVFACDPAAPYYDNYGNPVPCVDQDTITNFVTDGRFNLMYNMPSHGDLELWDAQMYLIVPTQWTLYETIWQRTIRTRNANFLQSFTTTQSEGYPSLVKSYTYSKLARYRRSSNINNTGGRYMLTVYARLDPSIVSVTEQVQTVMDLIGQWGAFANVLIVVFGLYFSAYNIRKFYENNPGWDRVNADMISENHFASELEEKPRSRTNDQTLAEPLVITGQ